MIPATAIAGASPVLTPVEQVGNWNSTTWTRNDRAYVAISKLPPEEITRHLTA